MSWPWPTATERVRERVPGFCFMAEVYWDLEWMLQQQGFDYTYDKRLYDRLREQHPQPVRQHFLAGLDYQGTFYLKFCGSAAGNLPWCERARFGVWSATKALANETALLRLAQKFGPGVFAEKISDYVPEAAAYPAWHGVRFEDAINMATGLGNGSG